MNEDVKSKSFRKEARFSEYGINYFNYYQEKFPKHSNAEVIEQIFKEHEGMKKEIEEQSELANKIYSRFKDDLVGIKLSVRNADKNVQILTEVCNGILFENDISHSLVNTSEMVTTPLKDARDFVESKIEGFRKTNAERTELKKLKMNKKSN
ncbi:hypothetical protein RAK27_18725 [Carnobacterium maltaromaticum]|uniref:Uncharacterized protein n=1 Tax=Carnobacterium maltaromaticum TaxID=2751 RepID=A0AAW9K4G8_CARML|nr:hypothetical protein [Carnobacterium maltaromaticum]MDZ5760680.1 hypothetical protein [Carnobacterium maltaromaticum]